MPEENRNDKMLLVRQGFEKCLDEGTIDTKWLKSHPLFFMALHDSDIYESELSTKLHSLFKSMQALNTFTETLFQFDNDARTIPQYSELFNSSVDFRMKFYKFFVKHALISISSGWNKQDGFTTAANSSTKKSFINSIVMSSFSVRNVLSSDIDITDIIDEFSTDIAKLQTGFKKYLLDKSKKNNNGAYSFLILSKKNELLLTFNPGVIW